MRPGHHRCPILRCPAIVPNHLLMCLMHWRRVPEALQAEVNDSYRDLMAGQPGAVGRYSLARRAAIKTV